MSEKLKAIWSSYEGRTSRRLTGNGVDNIAAPSRSEDWEQEIGSDIPSAAEAAFTALRSTLADQSRNQSRQSNRHDRSVGRNDATSMGGAADEEPIAGLLRGLASTERRTDRAPLDYSAFMASNAGQKLKSVKRKKRFLGIL
ncbi:MAG: hypothetical protein AAGH38_01890 [Pseudomonadota bacterium]